MNSRTAKVDQNNLELFKEVPNIFWEYFEPQFLKMFRPLDTLIDKENLNDWFIENKETIDKILKFVTQPSDDVPGLLIIRGLTGTGKTTTVRALFEKLRERLPAKIIYLYLNLSVSAIKENDLERDIDTQIHENLKKQFKNSYFRDVRADDETDTANRKRLNQLLDKGYLIVAVWDNVDQCAQDIQLASLKLAHHKLNWIKKQKIIIPVREYNFSRARAELSVATYDFNFIQHSSPSISDVIARRGGLFEKAVKESKPPDKKIDLDGGISITLSDANKFLRSFTTEMKEPDILFALNSLSNLNVRTQLDMIRAVLRSPYFTRKVIMDIFYSFFRDENLRHSMLPIHRFIEGLITCGKDNCYSVYAFNESFLINMFDTGNFLDDAYFNTLNKHHVAQMSFINQNGIDIKKMMHDLEAIGHPSLCTEQTIKEFLSCGLLFSSQGGPDDFPGRITHVSPTQSTRYYLERLISKLVYLQYMGVVTPLRKDFTNEIEIWKPTDKHSTFKQRMASVKALLLQIAMDEMMEIQKAQNTNHSIILHQNEFGTLAGYLATNVINEINAIKKASGVYEGMPKNENEWQEILEPFEKIKQHENQF